jgi:Zn-dependent metalloprotease
MATLRGICVRAVLSLVLITSLAWGQTAKTRPINQAGVDRLMAATGGQANISINRANGTARFIKLPEAAPAASAAAPLRAASPRNYDQDSRQFLNQYSTLFGIRDANSDLKLVQEEADNTTNGRHLTYRQYHGGVPVFGGMVKTHFDESGALRSINGMTVPDLGMNMKAGISAKKAAQIAVDKLNKELKPKILASSSGTGLFVYQQGLTKGVDLGTHLVWQVVVDNKANVREYVFIDAHTGKFVDQITGI